MEYRGTLSCACEWAQQGKLEDWVHAYLLSDGRNKPFSDGLKMAERIYLGPITLPLDLLHRCAGPVHEGLPYQIHPEVWERNVRKLMDAASNGADIPPLIAHYVIPEGKQDGEFELNDGNHRWEAYARLGIEEAAVIVWFTEKEEHAQFMARFGAYTQTSF